MLGNAVSSRGLVDGFCSLESEAPAESAIFHQGSRNLKIRAHGSRFGAKTPSNMGPVILAGTVTLESIGPRDGCEICGFLWHLQ